jgi:formylglycine-generating enzyme required for sulfatase activity
VRRYALMVLVPLAFACKKRETQFDVVDTPPPIPAEVPRPANVAEDPSKPDPAVIAKCVPGTGKNDKGECEALRTRKAAGVQQVQIPAGRFVMGDIPATYDASETRKEPRAIWSGQPPRYASSPGFWIDLHEVTREAYASCVESGKCAAAKCSEGAEDPVATVAAEHVGKVPQTCVTHEQAQTFCEHRGARLVTEAEYEYAARGTDARVYPWGNDLVDEYRGAALPITEMGDSSYFGIRGLGSNAIEWVAEPFEIDVGLKPYLDGEFRKPKGPLATAMKDVAGSFVVKGGRAGARQPKKDADPNLGFRCANDLAEGETPLLVPSIAAPIPILAGQGLQIFGGVAESVDREEAAKFCEHVKITDTSPPFDDFRLPTLEEVVSIKEFFRGPGPFWLVDGAATQHDGSGKRPEPDAPWTREDPKPSEPLAARCVRGP